MSTTHGNRIHASAAAFRSAADAFGKVLEKINETAATVQPKEGGWTPAQIGMHLALSNELFAGVLKGDVPLAQPAAAAFTEDPQVFSRVPNKITTFPSLEPPAGVTRGEALARLQRANDQLVAAIEALAADRASGHCVQLAFGVISLYQFAEFAGAHMLRHTAQLQRAIAAV